MWGAVYAIMPLFTAPPYSPRQILGLCAPRPDNARMEKPEPKLDPPMAFVLHFADRLLLAFAYPLFFLEFRKHLSLLKDPGLDIRGVYILPIIRDACLCTTLIALRDIDDVLAPRSRETKPGALKACDIGYPKASWFLTSADRQFINTIIVHSTTRAAHAEGKTRLRIEEVFKKGIAQGIEFLAWIKANYRSQKHSGTRLAADIGIKQAAFIAKHLKTEGDRHRGVNP